MRLSELLTCDLDKFHEMTDFIDNACNGIGLMNSLIEYQKELASTDERNASPITGYLLQKLCDLNGISNANLYETAYTNLITARLKLQVENGK